MENSYPHLKIDPTRKASLKDLPYDKYEIFCKRMRDWARTVTPNELDLICEKSKTNLMYFNHVKRAHQLPSRDWINRVISASIEITPHSPLVVDSMWL